MTSIAALTLAAAIAVSGTAAAALPSFEFDSRASAVFASFRLEDGSPGRDAYVSNLTATSDGSPDPATPDPFAEAQGETAFILDGATASAGGSGTWGAAQAFGRWRILAPGEFKLIEMDAVGSGRAAAVPLPGAFGPALLGLAGLAPAARRRRIGAG